MKRIILEFLLSQILGVILNSRSLDTKETFFSAVERLKPKVKREIELDRFADVLADVSFDISNELPVIDN